MLDNQVKLPAKTILKRLLAIALLYKKSIFLIVPLMILFSLVNAIPAIYIKNIIDALQTGKKYPIYYFLLVGAAIIGIAFIKSFLSYWQDKLLGNLGADITTRMRRIVYQKILYLPISFFNEVKTGHIFSRISGDLGQLQVFFVTVLRSYLLQIPQIIVLVGLMIYRSWILSSIIIIILPSLFFIIKKFTQKVQLLVEKDRVLSDKLFNLILETLKGIRIVKLFTTEKTEFSKFNKNNNDLLSITKKKHPCFSSCCSSNRSA